MAAIGKACADQVEVGRPHRFHSTYSPYIALTGRSLVFIDAPHILYPVDFTTNVERETVDVPDKPVEDHALTPRGWWTKADCREINTAATGLETSLRYLRGYLTHERFDVR